MTLHVGYGTFGHVHDNDLSKHAMHAERFVLTESTAQSLTEHRAAGGKVLAVRCISPFRPALTHFALWDGLTRRSNVAQVGTTATRTLETCAARAADGEFLKPGVGETDIFIRPGFEYQAVDALLTNLVRYRATFSALSR